MLAKSNCEVYVCYREDQGWEPDEWIFETFIRKNGEISPGTWTIHYKKLLKNEEVRLPETRNGPELIIFTK